MRNPLLNFQDVLRHLNSLAEGTHEDPTTQDYNSFLSFLDLALAEAWNSEWWPDLMATERRYFRALYASGTTYNKTNEVYFPQTQKYYQCLQDSVSGEDPATGDPLAENSEYWAESKNSYSASNWVTATAYVIGDKVFYPVTNRYYQCHTAHTSSSSLVPDATGANERWGVLTPFNRYVAWEQSGATIIGDCFDAKNSDPRVDRRWRSYSWDQTAEGIQILEEATFCWLQFRKRRPFLIGQLYDTTASYVVGDQVYFVPTGAKGNLYDCIDAAAAGQSPTLNPTKWSRVKIPQMFANYLALTAYSKSLIADGKHSSVRGVLALAEEALGLETDRIYRQSGRTPSLSPRTYPTTRE